MNYKMISRIISYILVVEVVFMIPALIISIVQQEQESIIGFLTGGSVGLAIAFLCYVCSRNARNVFRATEGLICVGVSWIALSMVGCIPFVVSGAIPHVIDAMFEMVSGFTTTGASILKEVESLPYGILYWRSFSHWLGGMGVLVFILALLPTMGNGSGTFIHILRAESPGPEVGKLVPHLRGTAGILYLIYIGLTILDILFLLAGGMPLFDAVCTAFGTAGTGGFGIKNDSIAGYSPYIQNVCTVFMLLFGVNFNCYYLLLLRQCKAVFRNEEIRLYGSIVLGSIALVTANIIGMYESLEETVRHAAFQVASIITTTGFATTNFDLWPNFSKTLLLCLMVIGACAGSTGGGMKCGRFLILMKHLKYGIDKTLKPNRIGVIKVDGKVVQDSVLKSVNAYLIAYTSIIMGSFLLIAIDGLTITTNFSAVLACFNNIGPGLELVGPAANYSVFGNISKVVLIIDMLAGRLEIFPILTLFFAWRK